MSVKDIYKQLVPSGIRNFIAGHPWVLRRRYQQLIREGHRLAEVARAAQKPDDKIRVTFIVQRPAWWPNQASVYEAMKADPDFEVSVIAIPKIPAASTELDLTEYHHLQAFLEGKGIAFSLGYDEESASWANPLSFGLPDIVFLPQPYTHTQHFMYHSPYLKHFCKLAIIPYSMTMTHLPDSQYEAPVYSDCRFIFIESETHKVLFLSHRSDLEDRLFVTGHPKLDAYLGSASRDMGLWKCPAAKHHIIWAPHFTVTDDRTPHSFSNFFAYYDFFLGYAKAHQDIEFVLRPHPELFEHMVATGMRSRAESDAYRDRFNDLPNGQVYEGGDIFTMFRQSDALILDSCGFLAEYAPTGRPICYLDSMRRQRLNSIGEQLLHSYYVAWDVSEIEEFIQTVVIEENDFRRSERLRVIARLLYQPPLGAAMQILKQIKGLQA